jgi:hypothetical protein
MAKFKSLAAQIAAHGSRIAVQTQSPPAALRQLKQPLYDTVECPTNAAAVNSLIAFQAPLGQALNVSGAIKNRADTNMSKSASIGTPNEFLMFGVSMCFVYDTGYLFDSSGAVLIANFLNDMIEVYDQGYLQVIFGQNKVSLQVPLICVPHGNSFITGAVSNMTDTETYGLVWNGTSGRGEFFKHFANKKPIFLDSEETITVKLGWPNAAMGLTVNGDESRMTIFLNGVYSTAI